MGTWLSQRAMRYVLFGCALLAFVFLLAKHYEISTKDLRVTGTRLSQVGLVAANRAGVIESCAGKGEFRAIAADAYVCTDPSDEAIYAHIYASYSSSIGGRERIYTFLDRGDQTIADRMLQNIFDTDRYEPVRISNPPTWEEDPFKERYWRFLYYSLRDTRHLLAAARETGNERYYEKLQFLIGDFITRGMDKQYAWDDYHGVAFRTMVLVNTWWKLREAGKLDRELSHQILTALERHGDFLLDPAHYESENNHGITEASALLVLAVSFPDLPNAPAWKTIAIQRINDGLQGIVDEDGVLVENSPYYHFYVLEKYWEIFHYTKEHGILVSEAFENRLAEMVSHGAYILQPDRDMPLLGASIPRKIERSGEFRLMAAEHPEFEYALTAGERGRKPERTHVFYPSSGIGVLRSGWGETRPYVSESHIVFDTGPYRTDHSDLDIMTVSAYTDGARVIREGGLFTYETDHPLYNYFHGTRAHNTVMVDGKDQSRDEGRSEGLKEGDGWAFVSAEHDAYPGVRHSRAVALIDHGALLVVDALASPQSHTYEQLFHLPPESSIATQTPQIVRGSVPGPSGATIPFTIVQLEGSPNLTIWNGEEELQRGLCAEAYEVLRACPELSYKTEGATAMYVTLILMGEAGQQYTTTYENKVLQIDTGDTQYRIAISVPPENVFGSGYIDLAIESTARGNFWDTLVRALRDLLP